MTGRVTLLPPFAMVVLLAFLLMPFTQASGQGSAAALYNEGNRAYADGDFQKAVDLYQKALGTGAQNHRLYYNLGTANYKLGRLGPAILNYERGLKLAPGDKDLLFNLRFARMETMDRLEEPEAGLLEKLFAGVAGHVGLPTAIHLAIVLYVLLCTVGLVIVIWRRSVRMRNYALMAGGVLLLVAILYGPFLYYKVHGSLAKRAVVLADKVEVLSGPGEDYTKVFTIHEGMLLKIQETRGGWTLVSIPSGFSGWLKSGVYEAI